QPGKAHVDNMPGHQNTQIKCGFDCPQIEINWTLLSVPASRLGQSAPFFKKPSCLDIMAFSGSIQGRVGRELWPVLWTFYCGSKN
ncbi:MAG: hypothetical protein ABSF34_12620, partial [Verrucomicrobiota bacterium]